MKQDLPSAWNRRQFLTGAAALLAAHADVTRAVPTPRAASVLATTGTPIARDSRILFWVPLAIVSGARVAVERPT